MKAKMEKSFKPSTFDQAEGRNHSATHGFKFAVFI